MTEPFGHGPEEQWRASGCNLWLIASLVLIIVLVLVTWWWGGTFHEAFRHPPSMPTQNPAAVPPATQGL